MREVAVPERTGQERNNLHGSPSKVVLDEPMEVLIVSVGDVVFQLLEEMVLLDPNLSVCCPEKQSVRRAENLYVCRPCLGRGRCSSEAFLVCTD